MGFYKVHNAAIIPKIGLGFCAGSDLYCLFPYTIPSNRRVEIRTGVALNFVSRATSNNKTNEPKENEERCKKERKEENKQESFCKKSFCKVLDDTFLKIRSRSGMASNHNISVVSHHFEEHNNNEIIVTVLNTGNKDFEMEAGTRFAQAIVHLTARVEKTAGGSVKYKLTGDDKESALLLKEYNGMGKMPVFLAAEECSIPPGSSKLVGTGIAVSLPSVSCYMQLQSPSPLHSDFDVQAGVIDADYRGEVKVLICNKNSDNPLEIKVKQPVAMGVVYDIACPIREIIEIKHPEKVKPIGGNMVAVIDETNFFYEKEKDKGIFSILRESSFLFTFFVQQDVDLTRNITKICTGIFAKLNTFKERSMIADIVPMSGNVVSWEIDSDTGEVMLMFKSHWEGTIKKGERIIRAFVASSPGVTCLEKVDELDVMGRGCRGFGSTGIK